MTQTPMALTPLPQFMLMITWSVLYNWLIEEGKTRAGSQMGLNDMLVLSES